MIETHRPSLSEIVGDVPWSAAETQLIKECRGREFVVVGDARPTFSSPQNRIRAELIRHILLGGCDGAVAGPKRVRLQGAWITDVLDLLGCDSPLDLFLFECHICEKPVLQDARLGAVMLPGCMVPGLNVHRLSVTRSMLLHQGFMGQGTVNLSSADIGGALSCEGGAFDGAGDVALQCDSMKIGESVFLSKEFTSLGSVNLANAQINGQLTCEGGVFDGAGGVALQCNSISVGGSVFCGEGFSATGQVSFMCAHISGQLSCTNGEFDGAGDLALLCDAMSVGESVFLNYGFVATGQVDLRGARVAGQVSCDGGKFDGAGGVALNCDTMTVGADIFLRKKFEATGLVNLERAQINGNSRFANAEFQGNLNCEGMIVGGGMYWRDVVQPPTIICLTDAHVGALQDDAESWKGCTPVLNGFRYDRIISEMNVAERLAWLETAEPKMIERGNRGRWYVPTPVPDVDAQPYTQFAGVLGDQGHRRDAAAVRYEREKRVRKTQNAKWLVEGASPEAGWLQTPRARLRQSVDWVFGAVFGYGHRPMRALLWVAGIWVCCFMLYGAAYDAGQMAPNSDVVLTSDEWLAAADKGCVTKQEAVCEMPLHLWQATDTATDYETFNRGLYALDLFVPLDALGQENAWAPSNDRGALGWWAYYARWVVQMSGWIITAVGAAALTGVIGRKE